MSSPEGIGGGSQDEISPEEVAEWFHSAMRDVLSELSAVLSPEPPGGDSVLPLGPYDYEPYDGTKKQD